MIQDEAALHQTIEQLERLYRLMWHHHREIYPKSPENFRLFTEGTIEHIQRLLKELDNGCGVTAALSEGESDPFEATDIIRKTG